MQPLTREAALFQPRRQEPAGAGTSGATATSGPPSSQISTTQNSDFWSDLTKALDQHCRQQDGRTVIVSPGSGVVLVKAFPSDLRAVENYLRITQLIVERGRSCWKLKLSK